MKKEIIKDVCQECGEPATYNLQSGGWKLWKITRPGKFILEQEWGCGDDENSFYCNNCAEIEGII